MGAMMGAMMNALAVAAAAIVMMTSVSAMALCPAGSQPWVDNWGNDICKEFGSGETVSVSPGLGGGCPAGSHPAIDNRGNNVCQEFGRNGRTYYDTSEGCPNGFHPSVDKWGNPICKSF